MNPMLRRIPSWLLSVVAGICIFWCVIAAIVGLSGSSGVRPIVRLGVFTHDPSAGSIPWRVTLREAAGDESQGGLEAFLAWRRRSASGFPLQIFRKRFELALRGDAPAGATPLSVEDAQSLLQSAFAALPVGADEGRVAVRNLFVAAIVPRSALDELVVSNLVYDLSVPLALAGALLSMRELNRRRLALTAVAEAVA